MTEILAGKYELIEPIGHGGMATVWRARDLSAAGGGRAVAVKRMLPNLSESSEFAAMFVEEARVVAALANPHIVGLLDFDRDERGRHFIVMEWVEGVDLGRCLQSYVDVGAGLPVDGVFAMAVGVLDALGAAHDRLDAEGRPAPIFHRDVTPSNVLLDVEGRVRLGDFGLARAMDRVTLTTPGVVKGKLAYVAPEMVGGARATARSDIYSFGVVLWECLAGRHLFDARNAIELFVKVGQAQIPRIDLERPDVPRDLADILHRALGKRPDERWTGAHQMAGAILDALGRPDAAALAARVAPLVEETLSRRTFVE